MADQQNSTLPQSTLLAGRTCLVTGAAMGIGEAIARAFHAQGANVVLADVSDAGEAVAGELGERAVFAPCDVSVEADVARAVDLAVERFGGLDVMVNNAGVGSAYDDPSAVEEADMDRTFAINQKGVMFGIKHAARVMADNTQGGGGNTQGGGGNGGSIINIASIAALSGGTSGFIYTGTKGAVVALTRSAALHLGDRRIRVNALAPGIILTPIYEASYPPGIAERVLSHQTSTQQPIRRLGRGADVAGPAVFLASDLSAYVTGQVIAVDGGYSATHRGALEAGFSFLQEVMAEQES